MALHSLIRHAFAGLLVVLSIVQIANAEPSDIGNGAADSKGIALGKKVKGDLAERMMDDFYLGSGYEKVDCSVGVNGADGVYVTRNADGTIDNVIVSECKTDTAQLGRLDSGKGPYQGSQEYYLRKIDEKIQALEKGPKTPETTRQINELKQIRRKIVYGDYRSRLFKMTHETHEGKTFIRLQTYELVFENGPNEKPVVRSKGRPAMIDMSSPDSALSPYKRAIRRRYYENLVEELLERTKKGGYGISRPLTRAEAMEIVSKLKLAYESGEVTTKNDLIIFIATECQLDYDAAEELVEKSLALSAERSSSTKPKKRVTNKSKNGRFISRVNRNVKGVKTKKGRCPSNIKASRGIMYEVEGQGGRKGIALLVHSSAVRVGAAEGIVAFVLSEGGAIYAYKKGVITAEEFERLTWRNSISSVAVGGAVAVAVAIGATPAGPVVLGIGIGGYWLCDFVFDSMERTVFTIDDVLGFIPDELVQVQGVFDMKGEQGLFDVEGDPSIFDIQGDKDGLWDAKGVPGVFDYFGH